nr:hypothetical protein I308_05596 [Cryptococcus tetragattii IND107]
MRHYYASSSYKCSSIRICVHLLSQISAIHQKFTRWPMDMSCSGFGNPCGFADNIQGFCPIFERRHLPKIIGHL